MKHSLGKISIVLIISTATVWQFIGAWQDSQTTDEAVHLVAGRSYWQTGNFELNPEHPALFKLWASLPLVLLPQAQIPTNTETWQSRNQWTIGAQYLYYSPVQQRYGSQFLMLAGRLPMILIWLALVVTTAVWSWRRWGPWAAITATALLAYDPNLLGHGHLVTNDVAVALAYLGTFLLLRRCINQPSWPNVLLVSLVLAAAQLTKYSAAILWILVPIVMVIAVYYRRPDWNWRWVGKTSAVFLAMSLVMTWAVYGFKIDRISADPNIARLWQERQSLIDRGAVATVPPLIQVVIRLADPSAFSGRVMNQIQNLSIPAYWYWRGFFSTNLHNLSGHGSYLMGQASNVGWWYYFPVALAVKTPLPLLLAVLIFSSLTIRAAVTAIFRKHRWAIPFDFWILGFPPLAFLAFSLFSHINIGLRHVFPTYVFWPLAAGALVAYIKKRHRQLVVLVSSALVVSALSIGTLAWPNTIGYFNGLLGGTQQGRKYLLDSNIDWNQDYWRLRSFLDKQNFSDVHIALFGSIPNNVIFPEMQAVLTDTQIQNGEQPKGIVAVSAYFLSVSDTQFSWLRSFEPKWRIGSSISVYDFR